MPCWKLFLTAIISTFALDMLWLGAIATKIYDQQIGFLMRKSGGTMAPIWYAALPVYLAIALGITCFVIPKANGNVLQAGMWGAIFGAIVYVVYDFTNFSILAGWPIKITFIDTLWGVVLCALSSMIVAYVQQWFNC